MNGSWGTQRTVKFGQALRRLRESRGLSLRTVGEKTHIDYSYLSRIEKGERRASPEVVEKLDAVLRAEGLLIDAWATENGIARPAQLPAAPTRFVGRESQIAELGAVLTKQSGRSPAVITIDGPAGAGKTALALRCANDLARQYFGGQLYCDLRGFTAARTDAVDPSTVLKWFCSALGAEPSSIPPAVTERAALYRSLLADRRVLVVIDNAANSRQVEYLLPGTGRCAVIVTSRRVLSGLTVLADAHRLPIGPLTEPDAVTLVRQLIGAERAELDPSAVVALTRLCGYLPLALRIAAERAVTCPDLPIQELVNDLSARGRRLDHLETGDVPGVRSVVSWSYAQLSTEAARTFRLLGIHGGSVIDTRAAAALTGRDVTTTRRNLDALDQLHLAELESSDAVRLHELLHAYAQEQTLAEDTPTERAAALDRLIHWYIEELQVPLNEANLRLTESSTALEAVGRRPRSRENVLRDIVRSAEATLESGQYGGTWQCAAALWNCLLAAQGDSIPLGTNESDGQAAHSDSRRGVAESSPSSLDRLVPRQIPRGYGDRLYAQAIAHRSTTADQRGFAWTLAGAALLAICCNEDDLARDFADQARELLDAIGEPDGELRMLHLASDLLRTGTFGVSEDVAVADVARFVAEAAADAHGADNLTPTATSTGGPPGIETRTSTAGAVVQLHQIGGE